MILEAKAKAEAIDECFACLCSIAWMGNWHISSDLKDVAIPLFNSGWTTHEISELLSISVPSIYRWELNIGQFGTVTAPSAIRGRVRVRSSPTRRVSTWSMMLFGFGFGFGFGFSFKYQKNVIIIIIGNCCNKKKPFSAKVFDARYTVVGGDLLPFSWISFIQVKFQSCSLNTVGFDSGSVLTAPVEDVITIRCTWGLNKSQHNTHIVR